MAQAFNLTAQLNLQGPANIGRIVSDIKRQIGTIEGEVKFKVDASTVKNVTQLNSALQTFNSTLGSTTSIASNAARALSDLKASINGINVKNISSDIKAAATATNTLSAASKKASKDLSSTRTELEEFGRQSALAIRRFAAFSVVSGIMFKVSNSINQGVLAFIDFERQLVKLEQITGKSQQGLQSLSDTISDLATGLGVSSASLINIADTLAQAGLSAKDTETALKALALTELAPSFDSLNETVEGSIALMRQFSISADQLQSALGSINSVAARFAVESSDLITAIQRTGGVFATASKGVSEGTTALNEFLAVFTSVRATTRESAETIATGLRTIFTRIQREDTIEALEEYGVQLTDTEGKFIGAYRAVEQLSRGLAKLDPRSIEFSAIVEELGGFRQIGKVIPLIQQFSTAQEALKVAQAGQDSLAYDAVTAQKSLANQIIKVREEFLTLVREVGQSDAFQTLARGALGFTSALISISDAVKGVLPILAIIGIRKGVSAATQFGKGFIGGLRKVKPEEEEGVATRVGRTAGETISGARSERAARDMAETSAAIKGNIDAIGSLTSSISSMEKSIGSLISSLDQNTASLNNNTSSIDALTLAVQNINLGGTGPTLNSGGFVKFATGGSVPGTGNKDSVPAMLTPGEFVVRKDAAKAIGTNKLNQLNRYAKGGVAKIKNKGARDGDSWSVDYVPSQDPISVTTRGEGYDAYEIKKGKPWEKALGKIATGIANKAFTDSVEMSDKNTLFKSIRQGEFSSGRPIHTVPKDIVKEMIDLGVAKKANKDNTATGFGPPNSTQINTLTNYGYLKEAKQANKLKTQQTTDKYYDDATENAIYSKYNLGGYVTKFAEGGIAQRKIGYIDYDVIANEANQNIVEQGMAKSGVKGPRLYTDYLTDLAVKARKNSSIEKLRAIYGVAGSGKTTLARGQGTDKGTLRETTRFPILSPDDIEKASEILVLTSSVSKSKLEGFLSDVDRSYTLSSTTQQEKELISAQRLQRDITGIGLEGRTPGVTATAARDTATGEGLLSDVLGSRSVVLGRTASGKLRRKRGDELVETIKKRIGFTWGGFAPMTAGHESIMDAAAAMGINLEDFIYLVGSNEGVKAGDPSSYRTAVFDQDFRVLLAKAGAGARGATVLPKPRDFEVPQAFDISGETGRRKVLIPSKGSTAFVADKTDEQTAKYKEAGYNVANIERTGGISGTMVRDLIMAGNMSKLQEVLSPGVYDLISNNIGRLQNRANVLPSIIEQVKQNQGADLAEIEKQIKAVGISRIDNKKAASDPEYAAKVAVLQELRDKRDKIKSAASFAPYKLLADLAQKEPEKYGLDFSSSGLGSNMQPIRTAKSAQKAYIGGLIRKFAVGGTEGEKLSRADILRVLTPTEIAAKVPGIRSQDVYKLLGSRSLDAKQQALREAIEAEYIKRTNRQKGAQQAVATRLANDNLVFGAAGMFGAPDAGTNLKIESDKLSSSPTVRIISGVLDQQIAQQLDELFSGEIENITTRASRLLNPEANAESLNNINAIATIQGALLETVVQKLGGPGAVKGLGFDFPTGLQGAAQYFGLPPDIPTDLKRTLSGPSTIKDNIITYLKNVRGYARGGKVDYYSLEKNSGFGAREFDTLVQYAKTNDLSLDEFQKYLQQRSANKQQNAQLRMNPISLLRAITPETPRATQKQLDLAEQLKGEPDAGYRPILTQAQRIAQARSDLNKAMGYAGGGQVSLYHGSNTGVNDSVLNSFKTQGARSDVAQGYGQGAGFYVYTEKNRAINQAKMRVGGGSNFTLAQGDTSGKPMVLTFNEMLDPATYDLDYELQKGLVVDWLYKNYETLKEKIAPKITAKERYAGVLGKIDKDLDKGIMSAGIRVQSDTGSRKSIYSGSEPDIREGELIGQIMNRLQANDSATVEAFESELFKSPLGLVLKYVGATPLKPTNIETFAKGGLLSKFASGGYVPALLTPGEAVIGPKLAKQIGYGNLKKMNHAEKYASGGDVSIVPGTGNGDTYGPVPLPVGSFVIRKKATQALGFNKGGSVKALRFMAGGMPGPGDVPKPDPADVKPIVDASKKAAGDIKAAMDYVRDQIVEAAKKAGAETYRSTTALGGTVKEAMDAANKSMEAAARQRAKEIYADRTQSLKGFRVDPNEIFKNNNFRIPKSDLSITPKDLKATAPEANPFYEKSTAQIKAESLAKEKEAIDKKILADQAASRSSTAVSLVFGTLGGVIQKVTKNMDGLGGVIGQVAAGVGTRLGVGREATKTAVGVVNSPAVKGFLDSIGSKIGFANLGSQVASVTKLLGSWGTIIYTGMGIVKDFYNGLVEAERKLVENKIAESSNRVSILFDKMSRDIDKAGTIQAINTELGNLANSLNRQSEIMRKGEMGFLNFFDMLGAMAFGGDVEERANQRALILQEQGILPYLQSSFDISGSTQQANYARMAPRIAEQRAEANRPFIENFNKLLGERLRLGETGADIATELGTRNRPSAKAKAIATQDIEAQLEIENVRGSNLSSEEKNQRIAALEFEAAKSILTAQVKAQEAVILSEKLNKITNDFVTSIDRLMKGMDQAINRSTFELQQLSASAKLSRESLSGKAGAGAVNLRATNILRNPRAYSAEERRSANTMAAAPFGIDAKLVDGLIGLPNELETAMTTAINKTIAEDRDAGEKKITTRVEKAAIDVIRQMDFGSNIESLLVQQTRTALEESRNRGEDKITFKELAERIPALAKQIDAANKAQETAIRGLEMWQSVLNSYSDAMNRQVQDQIDINNSLRKASEIRARGEIALSDALGKEVSLRTRTNASLAGVQSMTGGETNPAAISANILDLENTRRAEQQAIEAISNSSIGVTDNFQLMSQRLASTNLALRENYAALDTLANSSDIASAALSKVQEISTKIKAGETFIEKLVTSSPGEINKLNRSFGLLSNNLQGMANTGTTAEERGQTLQLFNMISPLLGTGQQQNELRANVLQSMLQESGIGLDSNLSSMIDSIRNPESLTEMQEAIAVYRSGVELQAAANTELAIIKTAIQKNDLAIANEQLLNGFASIMKNYQEKQLTEIAANTRDTANALKNGVPAVGKASGGIIYASKGQPIFKPKGTDTVPAMLTPGEFVVNKSATSKNLPLLNSINNGYSRGGKVSYYADGGAVAAFGKTVSSNEQIWQPGKLENITRETRTVQGQTSDEKYPTEEYIKKLLAVSFYKTIVPNEIFYGIGASASGGGNQLFSYNSLRNEAEDRLSLTSSTGPLPGVTSELNGILEGYIGNNYRGVSTVSGPVFESSPTYAGSSNNLKLESIPLSEEATNFQLAKNDSKYFDYLSSSSRDEYLKILESIKQDYIDRTLKYVKTYKDSFITNLNDYTKFRAGLPKSNATVSAELLNFIQPRDISFLVDGLSQPFDSDKKIGIFPSNPSGNRASETVGIGFDRKANLVSGRAKEQPGFATDKYVVDNNTFNRTQTGTNLFLDNIKLYDELSSLYTRFKKDPFSKDTEQLGSRKALTRKLLALYNNSANYIDLSESEFSDMEIDKLNDVRTAAGLSSGSIFPIRFYASNGAIPLQKDIDVKKAISNLYGEDFANYIYGGNTLKTQKLKLASTSGDINSIKTFSGWIPSNLVDRIVSGQFASQLGTRTSPVSARTLTYNDPDDLLSFQYNEIEPNSSLYNEIARRFDEKVKLSDKFNDLLIGGKLLTIDSTAGNNNPFNGMFGNNKQLVVKNSLSDLASRIKSAFLLAADPNKPDLLMDSSLLSITQDPQLTDYTGVDQGLLKRFAFNGNINNENLSFSQDFIKSYAEALASKKTKDARTAAGAVSKDLITKDIDTSFDEARRVTLGRIAYNLANSQGLNLTTKPENISDIENIRGILNSRIGAINNNSSLETIKLEAWRRIFTEISGAGLNSGPGKGRSYILAGAGIDIASINAGGTPKTIPDPALRGGTKTAYWDNVTSENSIQTALDNLLTRERNVLRAERLGANAALSGDVAEKARASLKNGMFVKTTVSPTGTGYQRTIDNQEAVLETYGDIFRYALTPSNVFANSSARGELISQLQNYYANAQGRGGELIFERDYVAKVNTALETLKSWYSDQDFLLNTGTNLQENINNYDKLVADRKMVEKYTAGAQETNPVVANTLLTNNQYGRLPYPDKMQANNLYDLMLDSANQIKTQNRANGGLIYASNGSFVNFQPKGTDTVPAMLTPGEFVVNKQATAKNLPLLKSINRSKGGKVSYYQAGGMVDGTSELDPKNSQGTKNLNKIDTSIKLSSGILVEILKVLNSIDEKISSMGNVRTSSIREWQGQNPQQTQPTPTAQAPTAPTKPIPIPTPKPPVTPEPEEMPEETGPFEFEPPPIPIPDFPIPETPDFEPIPLPAPTVPEIPVPDFNPVDLGPELPTLEDLMQPVEMPTQPDKPLSIDLSEPIVNRATVPGIPEPPVPSRNTRMDTIDWGLGVMTPEQDKAYFDEEVRAKEDRARYRQETINRNTALGLNVGNRGLTALEGIGDVVGGETTADQVSGALKAAGQTAALIGEFRGNNSRAGTASKGLSAAGNLTSAVQAGIEGDIDTVLEKGLSAGADIAGLVPDIGVAGNALSLAGNLKTAYDKFAKEGVLDVGSGFGAVTDVVDIASQVGPYTTMAQGASKFMGPAGAALEVARGAAVGASQAQSNDPTEIALAGLIGGATGDYTLGGARSTAALNQMGANIQEGGIADIELEYLESVLRGATTGFQSYGPAGAIAGTGVAVGGQALKAGTALYQDTAASAASEAETNRRLQESKTNNKSMSDPTYGMDTLESSYIKNIANAQVELQRLQDLQSKVGTEGPVGEGIADLVAKQQAVLQTEQQGLSELATQRVNDENTTMFTLGPDDPLVKARIDQYNQRIAQSIDQLGTSMAEDIDPANLPSLSEPVGSAIASIPAPSDNQYYPANQSYPIYNKSGGLIYANNGALVNFQPKGTDTVPAMLTPGEFVINKDSTQKHLGLLRAINSGEYSHGGLVNYLKNGGLLLPNYYQQGARVGPNSAAMSFDISSFMNKIIGQITSGLTTALNDVVNNLQNRTAAPGGVSTNIDAGINTIDQFVSRLDRIANTLKDLEIPPEIKIVGQHDVNVVINGDSALNQLKPELAGLVMDSIKNAFRQLKGNNPSWQDSFNFDIT
jgi:hypothetical protein